ncbi:MAG: hypothetical protein V9E98_11730 [Candidatus Nanopelagicales bacterium]
MIASRGAPPGMLMRGWSVERTIAYTMATSPGRRRVGKRIIAALPDSWTCSGLPVVGVPPPGTLLPMVDGPSSLVRLGSGAEVSSFPLSR